MGTRTRTEHFFLDLLLEQELFPHTRASPRSMPYLQAVEGGGHRSSPIFLQCSRITFSREIALQLLYETHPSLDYTPEFRCICGAFPIDTLCVHVSTQKLHRHTNTYQKYDMWFCDIVSGYQGQEPRRCLLRPLVRPRPRQQARGRPPAGKKSMINARCDGSGWGVWSRGTAIFVFHIPLPFSKSFRLLQFVESLSGVMSGATGERDMRDKTSKKTHLSASLCPESDPPRPHENTPSPAYTPVG